MYFGQLAEDEGDEDEKQFLRPPPMAAVKKCVKTEKCEKNVKKCLEFQFGEFMSDFRFDAWFGIS